MWQKGNRRRLMGGGKIFCFFSCLVAFCTLGDICVMAVEKMMWIFRHLDIFSCGLSMLREEEKIFCPATLNVGFAIHIQGSPQKGQDDGFKPTNQ